MRKLIFTMTFLLLSAVPAHAPPTIEACLNKVIETELTEYQHPNTKASHAVTIQHEGKNYHWINLSLGRAMFQHSEAIIVTSNNGHCSLLTSILGSYATEEEYDAALGKPISRKFTEAFRKLR